MRTVYWFITSAGVTGAAMIAMAVFAPETSRRLLSDCGMVTLRAKCLQHEAGTVLGEVCVGKFGPPGRSFRYADGMLGAADAIQRAGCSLDGPVMPRLITGQPTNEELRARMDYVHKVCGPTDPEMRRDEITIARQQYGLKVSCVDFTESQETPIQAARQQTRKQ